MKDNEMGNVYLVLIGDARGQLKWNVVQPLPIGGMLDAASTLKAQARQYMALPAPVPPQPVPEVNTVAEDKED